MSNSDQEPSPPLDSLQEVQELIKSKAKELLFAPSERIPILQLEIQKLRIVQGLYREVESGRVEPELYKNMNLLNRMTVGRDLEQETERQRTNESIEKSATKLRDGYGISPASANRIARVLGTVSGGLSVGPSPDSDDPEPTESDPIH